LKTECRGINLKFEHHGINPKLEYRNPKQIQMIKWKRTKESAYIPRKESFEAFGFWISDLFRISKFGFRGYGAIKFAQLTFAQPLIID